MSMINAVIVDLDNVLYIEKDYFYAAFDKIATTSLNAAIYLKKKSTKNWSPTFKKRQVCIHGCLMI